MQLRSLLPALFGSLLWGQAIGCNTQAIQATKIVTYTGIENPVDPIVGGANGDTLLLQFKNVDVPLRAKISDVKLSLSAMDKTWPETGPSIDVIVTAIDTADCSDPLQVVQNAKATNSLETVKLCDYKHPDRCTDLDLEWQTSSGGMTNLMQSFTLSNLEDMIQTIVNKDGWVTGNSICMYLKPEDSDKPERSISTQLASMTLEVDYEYALDNSCGSGLKDKIYMWNYDAADAWFKRYTLTMENSKWKIHIKNKLNKDLAAGEAMTTASQIFQDWLQDNILPKWPAKTADLESNIIYRVRSRMSWTSSGFVQTIIDKYEKQDALWRLTVTKEKQQNLGAAYLSIGSHSKYNIIPLALTTGFDIGAASGGIEDKFDVTANGANNLKTFFGGLYRSTTPIFWINQPGYNINTKNLPGECLYVGDVDNCPANAHCAEASDGQRLECTCIAQYQASVYYSELFCVPQDRLLPTAIPRQWTMENNVATLSGIPEQYLEAFVNATSEYMEDIRFDTIEYTNQGFFGWNNTCSGEFMYSLRAAEPETDSFVFQVSNKYGLSNIASVTIVFAEDYERSAGAVFCVAIFFLGLTIVIGSLIRWSALQALLAAHRVFIFCEGKSGEDDEEDTPESEEEPAYENPIAGNMTDDDKKDTMI